MSNLTQALMQQLLDDKNADTIAEQLGVDRKQAKSAITSAVPVILGGLNRNAQTQDGAKSLHDALKRDHQKVGAATRGVALSSALKNQQKKQEGQRMMGHVFGDKTDKIGKTIERGNSLPEGGGIDLMAMLGPIIMGALGQQSGEQGLDVSGLTAMLGQEQQASGSSNNLVNDLLGNILDQDSDGDFLDDLAGSIGNDFLGSLFG